MLKTVYYGFLVLNILLYVCFKKRNRLLEYASELFVALFIATTRYVSGSYIAADQYRYEHTYNNIATLGNYAIGYKLLNYLSNWLNLSFDAFYFIVTVICTIAIYHAVRKLKCNCCIVTIVFLLYYIIVAVDLLKNFIAFAILLNVFPYLLSNDKKDKLKYFIGIIVAATFHISFILFLLLLLRHVDFNRFKTSNNWKIAAGGIFTFIILVFIFRGQRIVSLFSNAVLSVVLRDEAVLARYAVYTGRTTHLSALVPIFIFIVMLVGLNIWKNRAVSAKNLLNESRYRSANVLNIFLVSTIYLPFVFTSAEFFRVIRDITVIGALFLSETSERTYIKHRFLNLGFVIAVSIGWFLFDIVIKGQLDNYQQFYFNIQRFAW